MENQKKHDFVRIQYKTYKFGIDLYLNYQTVLMRRPLAICDVRLLVLENGHLSLLNIDFLPLAMLYLNPFPTASVKEAQIFMFIPKMTPHVNTSGVPVMGQFHWSHHMVLWKHLGF